MSNITTGKDGENTVKKFLENKGHKVVEQNYNCLPFGEIDLITSRGNVIYFVEVKTRKNDSFMNIVETVNKRKYNAMKRACEIYIIKEKIPRKDYSFILSLVALNLETGNIDFYEDLTLNESL